MTSDIFLTTEQVIISAIKAQILSMTQTKQMFWNGVENDCVIAGGVFASLINDEAIKDIDVFILNKNVGVYAHLTDNPAIHDKWTIRDKDAGEYLDNPHIHGTALNLNTKVQYILTDYTSREELLKSFDYKHCTVSYVPKEMKLYITRKAFDAIRKKELIVNGDNKPKQWRYKKFRNRGWSLISNYEVDTLTPQGIVRQSVDYNKEIKDGYDQIIKDALGGMMHNLGITKTIGPADDEDLEAFRKLMQE